MNPSSQVCYHMGSETDPDERDRQTDTGDIDLLQRYIARCLPGLVPVPAVVESCLYTVGISPSHLWVLFHVARIHTTEYLAAPVFLIALAFSFTMKSLLITDLL